MKSVSIQLLLSSAVLLVLLSCKQPSTADESREISLQQYFTPAEPGVQNGNVKMVTIETPKGPMHVWTKRIGNNPSIRLLTLNGGPGCTHEYFECFESFLPAE